jgi:hypothetical protein
MPASILSFPNLQAVTINDFTPGVYQGSYGSSVYGSQAPLGSASQAFRCCVRPGIGLVPLPSYSTYCNKTFASGSGHGYLTMASMQVYAGSTSADVVAASWSKVNSTTPAQIFDIDTLTSGGSPATQFTSSRAIAALSTFMWPNLVKAFWVNGAGTPDGVASLNPAQAALGWVTVPSSAAFATSQTGTVPANGNGFKMAYVGGRTVFLIPAPNVYGIATLFDSLYTTDLQAMTNISGPSFFNPENGGQIGAWGSISTGEFIIIYQGGGAVIIYGDLQFPSSAISLPGVTGTGQAINPALPTPLGLVYTTDFSGVWVWNGGSTSQKISQQIPDNQFLRTISFIQPADITNPGYPLFGRASQGLWSDWIMFPNNWLYDTVTNSWWQFEDPGVNNFQVFGGQSGFTEFFYASPANAYSATGGTLTVPTMIFDRALPYSNYTWRSNLIPQPGADVTLGCVEICASNTSATTCTVSVQATAPPGQTAFPNQNPSQTQTFTIPPNTAGYRHSLPLGWNDYNLCVLVTAANTNTANAAPVLHELNLGYTPLPS